MKADYKNFIAKDIPGHTFSLVHTKRGYIAVTCEKVRAALDKGFYRLAGKDMSQWEVACPWYCWAEGSFERNYSKLHSPIVVNVDFAIMSARIDNLNHELDKALPDSDQYWQLIEELAVIQESGQPLSAKY